MKNYSSKSKNTLLIDSADNKEIKVGLRIGGKEYWIKKKHQKAQIVLSLIDKIMRAHKLEPSQLSAIEVNTGPGSFTGLRVGIAIANALGFSLKIPVNGKKVGEYTSAIYTK